MPPCSLWGSDTSMSSLPGFRSGSGVFGTVGVIGRWSACVGVMLPWVGGMLAGAGVGEVRYSSAGTAARLGIVCGLPKAGGKKRAPLGGGAGQGVVGGEVGAFLLLFGASMLSGKFVAVSYRFRAFVRSSGEFWGSMLGADSDLISLGRAGSG